MADQSEMAELRRQLQEVQRAKEDAEQRAEEERRAKEEERRAKEDAEQRAEEARRDKERATLEEYFSACHASLFTKFNIITNTKSTKSTKSHCVTNPRDKWCPQYLKPWTDFTTEKKLIFDKINETFPSHSRVFLNPIRMESSMEKLSRLLIINQTSLRVFIDESLETPILSIVDQFQKVQEVATAFAIGSGITFRDQVSALSNNAEEVVEKEVSMFQTPIHKLNLNQLRPDQICLAQPDNEHSKPRIVYVSEYKAPTQLTIQHLRAGLRPMDIFKDVVNRKTIPTSKDPNGQLQYQADILTASAITQTYHYMVEAGIEYGNLTIGEATVFLKMDWEEPETLLYHLAEPKREVLDNPNSFSIYTAVGQHLAFTLMALSSFRKEQKYSQDERFQVMNGLKTWTEDFETTLRSFSKQERLAMLDFSPGYQPTTYKPIERSPYQLRSKSRQISQQQHTTETFLERSARRTPFENRSFGLPETPTPAGRSTEKYCTQKCLLGLVQGGFLDLKCPNIALHCKNGLTKTRHPVSHKEWLELLWKQLKQTLDHGITDLGQGGARGVLFRVTLLAYGYTFVAKGTVRAFIDDLEHEAAVYERLKPLQGRHVPVSLGAIDLRTMGRTYYYFHRVYVVYMMFLSWGGNSFEDALKTGKLGKDPRKTTIKTLRSIHQQGVIHRDVRFANMLFNPELKKVMVIDFERALLLEPPRPALAQLQPNKRKRDLAEKECKKANMVSHGTRRAVFGFFEDINDAEVLFLQNNQNA
ncbi:hypothetical protein F4774DRAFT_382769 [Daldinia eschscholtzii]|nr:hypothetical protein F4774DRAFT_382769 [Daldinia eschscholtzii]